MCYPWDAAFLALNGIQFLLNKGDDYYNSTLLNESIRKQKFTGCSGPISISYDSNERFDLIFQIDNIITANTTYIESPVFTFMATRNLRWRLACHFIRTILFSGSIKFQKNSQSPTISLLQQSKKTYLHFLVYRLFFQPLPAEIFLWENTYPSLIKNICFL